MIAAAVRRSLLATAMRMITPGEWEIPFGRPLADAGQLRVPEQDELQALVESADEWLREAYSWEETMKVTRRQFSAGLAAGIAVPALLHTARAQGATIKIGVIVPITGPAAVQVSSRPSCDL
jgi:hypothetical protein